MADLHDIIEQVQVTLASSRTPDAGPLAELHGALDSEIRRANRRLRECDQLLANGHRTEAIQLAEQEPALLDVIAILDFPEFAEWNDFVAELGLNVAPELQIDIAADLNRAYSTDQPLEEHMRKLRSYSLARAPLRQRIDIIREIARMDAGNPAWEEDQRSYEDVRLRQLKEECREAKRNNDIRALKRIASELRGDWLVPPGRQLISYTQEAIRSIQSVSALERLREIAREIQTARSDQDLELAREAVQEWESLAPTCREEQMGPLSHLVSAAQEWIRTADAATKTANSQAKSLDRLRRSLAAGHNAEELRRRYTAVIRQADVEIPQDIQEQYDDAIQAADRKKKQTLMIAIGAGAFVLFLAVVAVVVIITVNLQSG